MKLITFSLWGQDPKYLVGALRNAELATTIYPDWVCRYYVGQSVPTPILYQLEDMANVQIFRRPEFGDWKGMYWRFEAAAEQDVEAMISRDTDSRLNMREKAAVEAWLASDKGFHIMRDHPHHGYPVLGGMWGAKKGVIPQMKSLIEGFSQEDAYGTDYKFFAEAVLPTLDPAVIMTHDEFFGGADFPTPRVGLEFVGEVFDENDNNVPEHTRALQARL
jgi:protein O-GlcNAc transferase